jgi:hypothetical protein
MNPSIRDRGTGPRASAVDGFSLMTRSEAWAVGRLLLSFLCAAVISAGGLALAIASSSPVVAWLLVPGAMLALQNMTEGSAGAWIVGGALLNLTLWSVICSVLLEGIRSRRTRLRTALARGSRGDSES